jgi:DNA-binding NarL/FixJ family response regulator
MRLFIADADPVLRVSLQIRLHEEPGMNVTGMAVQTNGLLAQLEASRPDVLLLDWQLPGASVEELLDQIKALEPPPKIIVLSVRPEVEKLALAAGADGFISMNEPPDELLEVVRWLRDSSSSGIGGS